MEWGLRLISDGTSESRQGQITVDIIAVHGLGANPDHAWVRHKDQSAGLENDVRWLTDLLPQTFRNYKPSLSARIFCFNYQSAWLGPQLSKNRLEGLAVRLLDDIHNARDKDGTVQRRPLIFIGHSFGGLVIEQAVVQANSAGGRYEYLVRLIGGIIFLGTPHQGSKSQKWGLIMANLANLIDHGESGLMNEVNETSMKIFDMICEFQKIMISTDLAKSAVICFYENRPTNYLQRVFKTGKWIQKHTSSMVVEETSAVLSGFQSIVLDSDHAKLNKFTNAQDGNYVSVSSNLCRIAAKAPEMISKQQKEPTSSQKGHFLVPRKRVKDFIGRGDVLDKIRSHFSRDSEESPQILILILYALGGQGKSQIALEYCRRWRDAYCGIFWIDANSEATVLQSYGAIAIELIGDSQIKTSDSTAQMETVKRHLEQLSETWLLVFDNYDEPKNFSELKQFIPSTGSGHVLFTSRNRDLGRLGALFEIPPMETPEGVRLLLRGYKETDIQPKHQIVASSIVERLGNLALAIDQAAAYITYKRILLDRLAGFLSTFEAERQKILSYTPKNFWEYEHVNAFTTWELSFQQLGSGDIRWKNSVAHFLTLSAFFAPTNITESIFRCYQQFTGSKIAWMQIFTMPDEVHYDRHDRAESENEIEGEEKDDNEEEEDNRADSRSSGRNFDSTWDPDRFWDVVARSDELSLLQSVSPGTDQEGASFSLHPLIRDWLQLRLKSKERAEYTQEAIEVLGDCAAAYDSRSMTLTERSALVTHMDVSLSNDERFSNPQDRLGHQLSSCGTAESFAEVYLEMGRYHTLGALSWRTIETQRSQLSEKHPATLRSMNYLAVSLCRLGKYEEVEPMLQRILRLSETELGPEHPETLVRVANFANVLNRRDKHGAEQLHRKVLTLRKTLLGKEHPDTLGSMGSLASSLYDQEKYEEAEHIHREELLLRKMVLGKEDPETLRSMTCLALVLNAQDKVDEAEQICREAWSLREMVLGKEHPATVHNMSNLALILTTQNKHEEAEKILRKALSLEEMVLGKEHHNTLLSMSSLAASLSRQNRNEEAEGIRREILRLREITQGKEHPDTLTSMDHLAATLGDQNKNEEAEEICRATLILCETTLGKEHPDSLTSMQHLAIILSKQNKNEEAEILCRESMILGGKILGKDHPDTRFSREWLVLILRRQGKNEEADLVAGVTETEQGTSRKGHDENERDRDVRERRRGRFSRRAKSTVSFTMSLYPANEQAQNHSLSASKGKVRIGRIDIACRMQSNP